MKWLLMLLIFIAGIFYLIAQKKSGSEKRKILMEQAKKEQIITLQEPALPVKPEKIYLIKFSMETLKTLRELTQDSNEKVRFAAAELLWQLQDETAPGMMKNMFENETDPLVKKSLLTMLSKDKTKLSLALLTEGLKDYDKETRLAAIAAIGTFQNSAAIPALKPALQDYDEEVRLKALEAVNRIRLDIEAHKEQQLRELDSKPLFRIE